MLKKVIERSERVERSKAHIRARQMKDAYERKRAKMMRNRGVNWNEIRTEFRKKYLSLPEEGRKNFILYLNREYLFPAVEIGVITGLKDYQIEYILYKDGGSIDEEGN